jgi:general secretion pathway protein M
MTTAPFVADLPAPARRVIALLLLILLAALLVFSVALPVWDEYVSARGQAAELEAALVRMRTAARERSALEAELAKLKARRSAAGLLSGGTDALAAAELQNRLKSTTESAAGEFRSVQILPPRDEGQFRRIAVRAEMKLRLGVLVHIVHQLEAGSPLLFLDNVDFRAEPSDRSKRGSEASEDDPVLNVGIDVSGYVRKPAGPGA